MFSTLVDTATLAEHLTDPAWVIFDCRFVLTDTRAGERAYQSGHIPGARYVHLDRDLSSPVTAASGRHPLPLAAALGRKLGAWGVDSSKQVVVHDAGAGAVAARLWWLLRWLGHEAVALLNGGLAKWQSEQRALTADAADVESAVFRALPDDRLWVDTKIVQSSLGDSASTLIDARARERFRGEVEPLDKVAGHIPGALNRPHSDNVDAAGCFLPAHVLRAGFLELLGGKPSARAINMCGSGVTACHNILAMEHAGLPGARLYPGSWSEWIRDPRHPIATGV